MIVNSSAHLGMCRKSFLSAVGKAVKLANEQTSSYKNVADRIGDLKVCHIEHTSVHMDIA